MERRARSRLRSRTRDVTRKATAIRRVRTAYWRWWMSSRMPTYCNAKGATLKILQQQQTTTTTAQSDFFTAQIAGNVNNKASGCNLPAAFPELISTPFFFCSSWYCSSQLTTTTLTTARATTNRTAANRTQLDDKAAVPNIRPRLLDPSYRLRHVARGSSGLFHSFLSACQKYHHWWQCWNFKFKSCWWSFNDDLVFPVRFWFAFRLSHG